MSIEEKAMTCFMCKGTVREELSTFTADINGCIVVVKNVPSYICSQCGEASFNDEVARQLEHIVHGVTDSVKTEIAVVSYSEKAA
jgi:YgiT-type zinc finger domain-containing protein